MSELREIVLGEGRAALGPGDFVEVRARRWLVEDVDDRDARFPVVALSCIDDDAQGEQLSVIWDAEIGARLIDDALKSGDSLVGLTRPQMRAANWDETKPGLPLLRGLIDERVEAALRGRSEIRDAPDDVTRAVQEVRHRTVEQRLEHARWIGDTVIAAFFAADKPRAREQKRQEVESWLQGTDPAMWDRLQATAASLREGQPHEHVRPFHWEIEFPEVFARANPGFDAILGNPPFAGKNTMAAGHRRGYGTWLHALHAGAHGNADLVAHFFRRAFALLRRGGAFGLIATNTIGQGDTRATGLAPILARAAPSAGQHGASNGPGNRRSWSR